MAVADIQNTKIVKKSNQRKTSKSFDRNKLAEVLENDENDAALDLKIQEKKAQGVVIDGKTYTCATCKAGHRVGVCKHAKERPMKATHPPGRPSAGAPKKVVCDCPKNCSCMKKDCKCARKCNCTQVMFMLVYIPAPGEDEIADDEKGTWKIDKEVMTDLKGNILTPEQVRERQERKDALKSTTPATARSRSASITANMQVESKSCCKHKENVASRNLSTATTGTLTKASTEGCNCGHACNCAFCPQHPNNATSINVAREQAMHFANHHSGNGESMVAFLPTIPQSISCMGGQPRFAMSRTADRPSFEELQHMFPDPGYVIGYPVQSNAITSPGQGLYPVSSVHPISDISEPSYQPMQLIQEPAINFSQMDFSIGNAFVASAGGGHWDHELMGMDRWAFSPPSDTMPLGEVDGGVDYISPPHISSNQLTDYSTAGFTGTAQGAQFANSLLASNSQESESSMPARSCCQPAVITSPLTGQFHFPPDSLPNVFDANHFSGPI